MKSGCCIFHTNCDRTLNDEEYANLFYEDFEEISYDPETPRK